MRILRIYLLVTLASGFSVAGTSAQDLSALQKGAEKIVRLHSPELRLIDSDKTEKKAVYNWGTNRKGIHLLIFYGESVHEATEWMNKTISFLSVGPGKKLKGLGDEAYFASSPKGDFAIYRFRKANVYMEVSAPSNGTAESIAKMLAKEIR
ncbi:MAG: hypothetical protein ABL999_01245 [Pyrinomonadaceae bacterium]